MMTGPKHQAPARGRYALLVIFAALVGIAAVLLHRAYEMWAPTHGRAIAGTWTETREEHWHKHSAWFGDFTPARGGPVRHEVPLIRSVPDLHVGRSIPAAVLGDHSDAISISDRSAWVGPAILGVGFAAGAGAVGWLGVNDLPSTRRRRSAAGNVRVGYRGGVRIGDVQIRTLGGAAGCLVMMLVSVVLSVVLTILLTALQ